MDKDETDIITGRFHQTKLPELCKRKSGRYCGSFLSERERQIWLLYPPISARMDRRFIGRGGGADHDLFDVVHFNVGLWDVLRLKGDTGTFTGEKEYEQVLLRLYKRIRMYCPDAAVIFALTTKVREPGFAPGITVGERRNSDIIRYNQIAERLWKDLPVTIDDLWSVSEQIKDTARSDDVHFGTEEGSRILGGAVIRCLRGYL